MYRSIAFHVARCHRAMRSMAIHKFEQDPNTPIGLLAGQSIERAVEVCFCLDHFLTLLNNPLAIGIEARPVLSDHSLHFCRLRPASAPSVRHDASWIDNLLHLIRVEGEHSAVHLFIDALKLSVGDLMWRFAVLPA